MSLAVFFYGQSCFRDIPKKYNYTSLDTYLSRFFLIVILETYFINLYYNFRQMCLESIDDAGERCLPKQR